MKIFLVNYDLRNDRNYNTLYDRLQKLGGIRRQKCKRKIAKC